MEIIVGKQGQQRVKINDPAVSRKHLKITTLPDGKFKLEDMSANGTFVNGIRIKEKVVSGDTIVQLGPNVMYRVSELMPIQYEPPRGGGQPHGGKVTPPPPPPVKEFSIKHLEQVWEEYERQLEAIQEERQNIGKKRMLPMMLSMGSGALAPILAAMIGTETLCITLPITAICLILYIVAYNQKDTGFEQQKEAKKKLIQKYVCPNPACQRFVGMQDYAILSQMPACPGCKSKWVKHY